MDIRTIITIIIVAIIVYLFFGWKALLFCIALGLAIALFVLVWIVLRTEGKTVKIKKFFREIGKNYKKFENNLFRWWDEL